MCTCIWRQQKADAQKAYENGDHVLAAELYERALNYMDLQSLVDSTSDLNLRDSSNGDDCVLQIHFEAAKVCTNISLMHFKIWNQKYEFECAKQSKKFAALALRLDKTWPKGFIRMAYAHILLSEFDEAMIVLERHNKEFGDTEETIKLTSLIKIRQKPGAEAALKNSKRYHLLKYPHSAFCIDRNGKGHFESLEELMKTPRMIGNDLSILIKPGTYEYPPLTMAFEYTNVDIVGDCRIHTKDGILVEDPLITFKPSPNAPMGLGFYGGIFTLRRLGIALSASNCSLNLQHCLLLSDQNPSVNAFRGVSLSCKSCRCVNSFGFILQDDCQVEVDKCYFKSILVGTWGAITLKRDISSASFTGSVFEDIPSCAINVSTGVKKFFVKDCKFKGIGDNKSEDGLFSAICTSRSDAVIQDTSISSVTGTGILIGGAKTKIRRVKIEDCSFQGIGVSYTDKMSIKQCEISGCPVGVSGHCGTISFEGNKISSIFLDVMATPMCQVKFLGKVTHTMRQSTDDEWKHMSGLERDSIKQKMKTDPLLKQAYKGMCAYCKRDRSHVDGEELDLKACGGCKHIKYCSVACQKKDWKYHKDLCKYQTKEI